MPPHLACYLIRAPSNLTRKIQKIANSSYWLKSAIIALHRCGLNLGESEITSGWKNSVSWWPELIPIFLNIST